MMLMHVADVAAKGKPPPRHVWRSASDGRGSIYLEAVPCAAKSDGFAAFRCRLGGAWVCVELTTGLSVCANLTMRAAKRLTRTLSGKAREVIAAAATGEMPDWLRVAITEAREG